MGTLADIKMCPFAFPTRILGEFDHSPGERCVFATRSGQARHLSKWGHFRTEIAREICSPIFALFAFSVAGARVSACGRRDMS